MLEVRKLTVIHKTQRARTPLLSEITFSIKKGEMVALVGESGSGKTLLSRSLTLLFPPFSSMDISGSVRIDDVEILEADERTLRKIRQKKIRYIFQDPATSLNPLLTVRTQMKQASNGTRSTDTAFIEALETAGLHDGTEVLDMYPHQLSIGMAQRVLIAMAILPDPAIIIADEPTSAIDASLRFQVLHLLEQLCAQRAISFLLITHDMENARTLGDRIMVLYRGRIVEAAKREVFFGNPLHPYSKLLLDSTPVMGSRGLPALPELPGRIENHETRGCSYYAHCPKADDKCAEKEPSLEPVDDDRNVRCYYWK